MSDTDSNLNISTQDASFISLSVNDQGLPSAQPIRSGTRSVSRDKEQLSATETDDRSAHTAKPATTQQHFRSDFQKLSPKKRENLTGQDHPGTEITPPTEERSCELTPKAYDGCIQITARPRQPTCRHQLPSGFVLETASDLQEDLNLHVTSDESIERPPLQMYQFYQSDIINITQRSNIYNLNIRLMMKCLPLEPYDRVLVFKRSDDGNKWHEIPSYEEKGYTVADIDHLSWFIAISQPYRDTFTLGKKGGIFASKKNKDVTLIVPKEAIKEDTNISMEVVNLKMKMIENVSEENCVFPNASFSPIVYIKQILKIGQ
ncbi:uncharacterized protein [Ptychodera flava]|uniref:uncharacterized protein n=1 Tax=Ptychodera flava TaxID=63121 RepID=UPI003969D361